MNRLSFENTEFLNSEPAFPIRILSEWIHPKEQLEKHNITDTIVLFGSARIPSPEKLKTKLEEAVLQNDERLVKRLQKLHGLTDSYQDARRFASLITEWGAHLNTGNIEKGNSKRRLVISTGGGPGIMEAGNRGAKEQGGESLALNIALPYEQSLNPYCDPEISFQFHYFFMRKYWFVKMCRGLVAFPGGFGTFDEVFETLTLIQTKKRDKIPVVLYNSKFWKSAINLNYLADQGLIDEDDLNLFHFSDSPEDAFQFMRENIKF
jgi:uncharacterized protein (TIGR00730 family)